MCGTVIGEVFSLLNEEAEKAKECIIEQIQLMDEEGLRKVLDFLNGINKEKEQDRG